MKKIHIALDIDDVLADSTEAIRLQVNAKTLLNIPREAYRVDGEYWGYYEQVWQMHGLTSEEVTHDGIQDRMAYDQSHVSPIEGAQAALGHLAKSNTITLVTSRSPEWADATEEWMKDNFGGIFNGLHVIGRVKKTDGNSLTKGEVCRDLGVNWLIDDSPEHCLSAVEHGIGALLFGSYGWHYNAPATLQKHEDWPSIVEFFDAQLR
jgi:FMN phosphatase YigB (HAD superfamily)